ncbi:MAG: hypothetical protein M0R06_00890 [Sphaerochaeta sp.]|jgi:hypothetical protein|nr:hypothetical protein [Sphaerochaeta sp.]
MYASVVELNGTANPIRKMTKHGPKEIYRARLVETGDPKISITITTEDPEVLEDILHGSSMGRYEILFEKMVIGNGAEE